VQHNSKPPCGQAGGIMAAVDFEGSKKLTVHQPENQGGRQDDDD
jgi:hypothetical protein